MTSRSKNNWNFQLGVMSVVACVLIVLVAFLAAFAVQSKTGAHEEDDDSSLDHMYPDGRWVFECEDAVSGCQQGGLLYHTKDGPDGNVYFIVHYSNTGNVYARKVEFAD